MTTRFGQYWQQLRESLWFVPGLLVLAAFGLAFGLVEFDANTAWKGEKQFPLLFGTGAEGSRGMLTAIAGSMLTVAALIFSLTLAAITQVSSQYSPRVLRNFMRDRVNQVVMGYFIAVFAYCLLVLGTIRGTDEQKFVPATAVLAGLVLALGGIAALILFIHHIAESLQTGTIVQHVFNETGVAIGTMFPDHFGEPINTPAEISAALRYSDDQTGWWPVRAQRAGYLQRINTDNLLQWAIKYRVVLRIEQPIGAFVGVNTVLFSVRSDMQRPDLDHPDWPDNLVSLVRIGKHRNIEQDVAFGIQQLVDITLKALSPGINDTTTAIMSIDYLGAVVEQLARRDFPTRLRSDGQQLRLVVQAADFDYYVQLAFDLPRINAKGNHAVIRRLVRVLSSVNNCIQFDSRKAIIRKQMDLLLEQAEQTLATSYEKQIVRDLYQELTKPATN